MKRAYKTSKKKRTNYIYYTAEGTKIVITPGEDGVTEADIELLHTMDDDEVDEQRRYDYRVTTHLDAYHDGEEEAANDRNKYLADDKYTLKNDPTLILQQKKVLQKRLFVVALRSFKKDLEKFYPNWVRKNPL